MNTFEFNLLFIIKFYFIARNIMTKYGSNASSVKRRLSAISTAMLASACVFSFSSAAFEPSTTAPANLSISHASLTGTGGHTFELGQLNSDGLVDLNQPAFSLNLEVQSNSRQANTAVELTFELVLPGIGAFPLWYSDQDKVLSVAKNNQAKGQQSDALVAKANQVVTFGKDLAVTGKVGKTYELFLSEAAYEALKDVDQDTMAQVIAHVDGKNMAEKVSSDNHTAMSVVFLPNSKKVTADRFSVLEADVDTNKREATESSAAGYSKTWFNVGKSASYGNSSYFAGGYSVGAKMTYQETANRIPYAVNFDSPNNVSVYVFGNKQTILQANAGLDFNADNISGSYFKYNVDVAGSRIWQGNYAFPTNANGDVVMWQNSHSKYKQYSRSKTFTIGPVPVNVNAGAKGTVGLGGRLLLKPQNNVVLTANVNGSLNGFAEAGVDALVFRAGAGANLNVIDVKQELVPSFQVTPSQGTAKFAMNAPLSLDTLDGKVYIYADGRSVKTCKKWGIPYPCGFKWSRLGDKTLINWDGYSRNYNLVNKTYVWN
ncbi:MAG: hypothetical protein ACI8WB_005681 [Phenylobacterium sp.]|jgi:hypothetical protein